MKKFVNISSAVLALTIFGVACEKTDCIAPEKPRSAVTYCNGGSEREFKRFKVHNRIIVGHNALGAANQQRLNDQRWFNQSEWVGGISQMDEKGMAALYLHDSPAGAKSISLDKRICFTELSRSYKQVGPVKETTWVDKTVNGVRVLGHIDEVFDNGKVRFNKEGGAVLKTFREVGYDVDCYKFDSKSQACSNLLTVEFQ